MMFKTLFGLIITLKVCVFNVVHLNLNVMYLCVIYLFFFLNKNIFNTILL